MLKDFYKDGDVFEFYLNTSLTKRKEEELILEGYTPVFDNRKLHWNNGRGGSLILENDINPPNDLVKLQTSIKDKNNISSIHKIYNNLHPAHIPIIKQDIETGGRKQVRNILIDSLFKDIKQFRYVIEKLFADYTEMNYFINSHGTLIDILNEEFDKNMDKYTVRNPFYVHGRSGKPYFNELYFTCYKNYIYEIQGDIMKRIKVRTGYEKCEAYYEGEYKFIFGDYKAITEQNNEKKSKWD